MQCTICLHRESQQSRRPQFKFDIASSFEKVGRERQREGRLKNIISRYYEQTETVSKIAQAFIQKIGKCHGHYPVYIHQSILLYLKGLSMSF